LGHWGEDVEAWTIPVAEGDARCVVAFLVRGQGREAVVLTGHYDTVTTADYGELAALAISPEALLPALMRRLANAATPAEAARRADFAVEGWLPGRGLLDMKGGLAAGLAAMAAHAATPARRGNLLFLAVPDEEYASTGARAAALALPGLARERDLDVVAAINLDSISDDADGVAGRVVALGTVGKVLPTAFVVGEPVHSGFPLRGLNAAVLAGAIARALEWAPELTDESAAEAGTPVSLLSLRDGKVGYDVTTPATAWATWSVLNHRRDPSTVLRMVERLVREAADACLADLAARAARSGQPVGILAWAEGVRVMRWSALLKELRARDPAIDAELAAEAGRLRDQNLDLPEACHRLTAWAWRRSGLAGPAVVLGLGSIPYLATELRSQRVRAAVEALAADAPARHGTSLAVVDYFAGISDMSFFGQATWAPSGASPPTRPPGTSRWACTRATWRRCRRSTSAPGGATTTRPSSAWRRTTRSASCQGSSTTSAGGSSRASRAEPSLLAREGADEGMESATSKRARPSATRSTASLTGRRRRGRGRPGTCPGAPGTPGRPRPRGRSRPARARSARGHSLRRGGREGQARAEALPAELARPDLALAAHGDGHGDVGGGAREAHDGAEEPGEEGGPARDARPPAPAALVEDEVEVAQARREVGPGGAHRALEKRRVWLLDSSERQRRARREGFGLREGKGAEAGARAGLDLAPEELGHEEARGEGGDVGAVARLGHERPAAAHRAALGRRSEHAHLHAAPVRPEGLEERGDGSERPCQGRERQAEAGEECERAQAVVEEGQLQPRAEAHGAGPVAGGEEEEVRGADEARPAAERASARSGQRLAPGGRPAEDRDGPPPAPERERPACLGEDGAHDREPTRRAVAGQDHALDEVDVREAQGERVGRGARQGGHAGGAREHRHAPRPRGPVEGGDAGREGGVVRQVEVVRARVDRRLHEGIRAAEGPGRVDDDRRRERGHPRREVGRPAVEARGLAAMARAEGIEGPRVAPGDDDAVAVGQEARRHARAEDPRAADDEDRPTRQACCAAPPRAAGRSGGPRRGACAR
jgi:arginine utilization protein RocB